MLLNILLSEESKKYGPLQEKCNNLVNVAVDKILQDPVMKLEEYDVSFSKPVEKSWLEIKTEGKRQVKLINEFFKQQMSEDSRALFIGEDVLSPYGGAFKVADGLSSSYQDNVITTPISEAAIVGISNGLAISGFKPYVEIMFGDFTPLIMDQLINNSSKFHHMYNKQVNCPIVIRTPMGGKRGYGPTHSQTLDKFLIGIDNVKTIALNTMVNPSELYSSIHKEKHPVIVIENKLDYGKLVELNIPSFYQAHKTSNAYPVVKLSPIELDAGITIVTYGGMLHSCLNSIDSIFSEYEVLPEILVLSQINPIDVTEIVESVRKTQKLLTVEEGSSIGGIGSEIIALYSCAK